MGANSKKIIVCFKLKNAKYQELRNAAIVTEQTQTRILTRGLERELQSLKRRKGNTL